jgi:hypothetical protein
MIKKGLGLSTLPDFFNILSIKPKTININGFEVPEPVREKLDNGDRYWVSGAASSFETAWADDDRDNNYLNLGLIHLTKEAAELHREALLSFTKKKD